MCFRYDLGIDATIEEELNNVVSVGRVDRCDDEGFRSFTDVVTMEFLTKLSSSVTQRNTLGEEVFDRSWSIILAQGTITITLWIKMSHQFIRTISARHHTTLHNRFTEFI